MVNRKPSPAEERGLLLYSPMHISPQVGRVKTHSWVSALWLLLTKRARIDRPITVSHWRQTWSSRLQTSEALHSFSRFRYMLMFSLHQPDFRCNKPDGKTVERMRILENQLLLINPALPLCWGTTRKVNQGKNKPVLLYENKVNVCLLWKHKVSRGDCLEAYKKAERNVFFPVSFFLQSNLAASKKTKRGKRWKGFFSEAKDEEYKEY